VFDPCCGSGGMFIQSEKFIEAHQGRIDDIFIFGQESNQTTWRLCKMNLAIRGIEAKEVRWNNEGSFLNDLHKDLRADYLLANPPFNDSDWKGEMLREDIRWKFGVPPVGNANFAWVQHFVYHLAPNGIAGFVLANGSMSSNTSGEGEIRKNIVEADLLDCMVALPSQLFYNTPIPACLWFISKDRQNHKFRDRRGEILFIDARKMGVLIDRKHRELKPEDIKKIVDTYHAWRCEQVDGQILPYQDVAGFCKAVKREEIQKQGHILTPGRYVGAENEVEDEGTFDEKMKQLTTELAEQMINEKQLDDEIRDNLRKIGYGF
jgi:type I restriction enzyme M protein